MKFRCRLSHKRRKKESSSVRLPSIPCHEIIYMAMWHHYSSKHNVLHCFSHFTSPQAFQSTCFTHPDASSFSLDWHFTRINQDERCSMRGGIRQNRAPKTVLIRIWHSHALAWQGRVFTLPCHSSLEPIGFVVIRIGHGRYWQLWRCR